MPPPQPQAHLFRRRTRPSLSPSPSPSAGRRAPARPRPRRARAPCAAVGPPSGASLQRALQQVPAAVLPTLMNYVGDGGLGELERAAAGLGGWRRALKRGHLPDAEAVAWPEEPFRTTFAQALLELNMAHFCARHPSLTDTLLNNMLEILRVYEAENDGQDEAAQQPQDSQMQSADAAQQGESAPGSAEEMADMLQQAMESAAGGEAGQQGQGEGEGGPGQSLEDVQISLEADQQSGEGQGKEGEDEAAQAERERRRKELAERLMDDFKEQWEPAAEKLEAAEGAFGDNVADVLELGESSGFDLTQGVWQQGGWRELKQLARKLEDLKELRDLVRTLGRGSGMGPLKRAPAQVERQKAPPGVVRSALEPLETRGLTRTDDISRMLPAEAQLLAEGRRSTRLLFHARRHERMLTSYDMSGWAEENARTLTRTEIRPSAEKGPIIACLDTSASMQGGREVVAKALALECMRQAHREERACYLYGFSGPGDVVELELAADRRGLEKLLAFLGNSFNGGTNFDEPLRRSLQRLGEEEWQNADLLVVSDGEMGDVDEELAGMLDVLKEDQELKVHSLIVSDSSTGALEKISTEVHQFNAWSKVGGQRY